jgi:DNA-directed RNA polymerase subunit E'/Rpb7
VELKKAFGIDVSKGTIDAFIHAKKLSDEFLSF